MARPIGQYCPSHVFGSLGWLNGLVDWQNSGRTATESTFPIANRFANKAKQSAPQVSSTTSWCTTTPTATVSWTFQSSWYRSGITKRDWRERSQHKLRPYQMTQKTTLERIIRIAPFKNWQYMYQGWRLESILYSIGRYSLFVSFECILDNFSANFINGICI